MLLTISDNGRGYDLNDLGDQENGRGLGSKLMSAFSRQLSADFRVETQPGDGCSLTLFIPVSA
jgi:nitrate/nitrite-specific signal transduction histidine kinase